MDGIFRALADETRRRILALTGQEERSAGAIAAAFDMSRPAISQHLRVLLDAGLVEMRRQGTRRFYRARPDALAEARRELETLWHVRLGRLKAMAEGEAAAAAQGPNDQLTAPAREAAE